MHLFSSRADSLGSVLHLAKSHCVDNEGFDIIDPVQVLFFSMSVSYQTHLHTVCVAMGGRSESEGRMKV